MIINNQNKLSGLIVFPPCNYEASIVEGGGL